MYIQNTTTKLCENSLHFKKWRSCKPRSTSRNIQKQCENQIYPTYQHHPMTKHDPFSIISIHLSCLSGTLESSLEPYESYESYVNTRLIHAVPICSNAALREFHDKMCSKRSLAPNMTRASHPLQSVDTWFALLAM